MKGYSIKLNKSSDENMKNKALRNPLHHTQGFGFPLVKSAELIPT
jgi:hypothetical protein